MNKVKISYLLDFNELPGELSQRLLDLNKRIEELTCKLKTLAIFILSKNDLSNSSNLIDVNNEIKIIIENLEKELEKLYNFREIMVGISHFSDAEKQKQVLSDS